MTQYFSTYKFYVCDILNSRCVQEPEDYGYSQSGPDCENCAIANEPEPIDTELPQARSTIKLV